MLFVGAQAQTVNVHLKNGTTLYFSGDSIECVDFNETTYVNGTYMTSKEVGGLVWLEANVGAQYPWEPGRYFLWCVDDGYTLEGSQNITFNKSYYDQQNKVNANKWHPKGNGFNDDKDPWRVPTVADFNTLISRTTQHWGTYDSEPGVSAPLSSVTGIWFTDDKGNKLFFPAVGLLHEGTHAVPGTETADNSFQHYDPEAGHWGHFGCYWTSTSKDSNSACGLFFGSEDPAYEKEINVDKIQNRIENTEYKWYALPIRLCRNK